MITIDSEFWIYSEFHTVFDITWLQLRSCFDLIACTRSTFCNGCILSSFFSFTLTSNKFDWLQLILSFILFLTSMYILRLANNWDRHNGFQRFPGSKLVPKTVENRSTCLNYLQVAVCMFICICIYTYMNASVHTYPHVHQPYLRKYTHTSLHTYIHTHVQSSHSWSISGRLEACANNASDEETTCTWRHGRLSIA